MGEHQSTSIHHGWIQTHSRQTYDVAARLEPRQTSGNRWLGKSTNVAKEEIRKVGDVISLYLSLSLCFCILDTPSLLQKSSDVKFCSFYLSPERCNPLSFQRYVCCCGYDRNMMQGRAVSEKDVAGGSALPRGEGPHLDCCWWGLTTTRGAQRPNPAPEKMQGSWRDLLELIRQ